MQNIIFRTKGKLNKNIDKSWSDRLLMIVIYMTLVMTLIVTLYPFIYTLIMSFNESVDAARGGIYFWPREFTLENYRYFFSNPGLSSAIMVSVMRTVIGTVATLLVSAAVGYALSFDNLLNRKFYIGMMVVSMYFSGGLIPTFIVLKEIGLLNNFWVYILPNLMNTFLILIGISFFKDLPPSLHESAKIDGASELKIFVKIILPLSKPLLATIALFSAVGHWNSWVDVVYYTYDKSLRTLSYMLVELMNTNQAGNQSMQDLLASASSISNNTLQVTAIVVTVFPIVVIYPFLQKYFVKGVTVGAVKG